MPLDNAFDSRALEGFNRDFGSLGPRQLTTGEMRSVVRGVEQFVSSILGKYYDHGDHAEFDVLLEYQHFEFYWMCDQRADVGIFFMDRAQSREAMHTLVGPQWIRTNRLGPGSMDPLPMRLPRRGLPLLAPSMYLDRPEGAPHDDKTRTP